MRSDLKEHSHHSGMHMVELCQCHDAHTSEHRIQEGMARPVSVSSYESKHNIVVICQPWRSYTWGTVAA